MQAQQGSIACCQSSRQYQLNGPVTLLWLAQPNPASRRAAQLKQEFHVVAAPNYSFYLVSNVPNHAVAASTLSSTPKRRVAEANSAASAVAAPGAAQ